MRNRRKLTPEAVRACTSVSCITRVHHSMMHLCSGSQLSSPRSSTMKEHRTRLHACSIERIGDVGGAELFACGTYELDESSSSRHGEIVLFNGTGTIGTTVCESGVLDMKVVNDMVCVALSAGSLALYRVVYCGCDTSIDAVALHIETVTDDPDEGLFLSLDIDNRLLDSCWKETTNIAVSTQQGSVIVFEYLPAHDDVCASLRTAVRICNAHSMLGENMPAWIVLFDPHSKRKLISGGDDMVMKLWDLPDHSGSADVRYDSTDCLQIETPTSVNRKAHTAGVTSGQWHPHIADIFATGSYDEHVRVWDMRNVSKPLLVLHTGGGVWRVKWFVTKDSFTHYLVLACMHGGCRVCRLNIHNTTIDSGETGAYVVTEVDTAHHIDTTYDKHLAYGIDIVDVRSVGDQTEFSIASCSFYDNLVHIWNCKL